MKESEDIKIGATRNFPAGKLCDADEGGLNIVVGTNQENNRVILFFGEKPISWIGFTKADAERFAKGILDTAKMLRK